MSWATSRTTIFQVLKLILKKLGYADWSDHITHLSYGMVELPEGKMKSREGTVVDADDLIADMVSTAREMSDELGKLDGLYGRRRPTPFPRWSDWGAQVFHPEGGPEKDDAFRSARVDRLQRQHRPVHQYTHARICSVLRKAAEAGIDFSGAAQADYLPEEIALVKSLTEYPSVVAAAGENFAPSIVGAYVYELAKQFNGYYHDHSILKGECRNPQNASSAGSAGRPRHPQRHETARYRRSGTDVILRHGCNLPHRPGGMPLMPRPERRGWGVAAAESGRVSATFGRRA